MKNAENIRTLLHAMNGFAFAYDSLRVEIEKYESETGASVNDLPGFTDNYPFDKSFDELAVDLWVSSTVDKVRQSAFKVLNYEYLNTGGNCMVGVFEVWLPEKKQTVYVYVNEEGYTMSVVDYIRHELEIHDYDELMIECGDWGRVTGHETYFELYRHCLNEYTKSDCRYFGYIRELPYHLLSDELQNKVPAGYREWCDTENGSVIGTNGEDIVVSEYFGSTDDDEKMLEAIKEFRRWHDTTAGVEEYYNESYKLELAGHKIELPFMADVWDAVDTMLERTIRDW